MKNIKIKNKYAGPGIKYIGWSGRGWADGGPIGAGPINYRAPSWDSCGKEIGINMVRVGFSMKHFLPDDLNDDYSLSAYIKKGMENAEVSWAKSKGTSYSLSIKRCCELGWKILICINPSLNKEWEPHLITSSSYFLQLWEEFCFHLAKLIDENWPGMAEFFEITNEPDIGYFDGETSLPDYKGIRKGITPFQYRLLLQHAYKGIKKAAPDAKIIGPSLASWDRKWIKEILMQSGSYLNGISYHNVMGNLRDMETLKEARELLSNNMSQSSDIIFNSEWAWWPNHDTDNLETALRVAQILYLQAVGNAYASLYLGPAQPRDFKKGLGVLKFYSNKPNLVEKTLTYYALRLMIRGVLGGNRLELFNPLKKLEILALFRNQKELVISLLNPSKKRFRDISIRIDESINLKEKASLKVYQFDNDHRDDYKESSCIILKNFDIEAKSINQFVIQINNDF
jgi:hypothetical protein